MPNLACSHTTAPIKQLRQLTKSKAHLKACCILNTYPTWFGGRSKKFIFPQLAGRSTAHQEASRSFTVGRHCPQFEFGVKLFWWFYQTRQSWHTSCSKHGGIFFKHLQTNITFTENLFTAGLLSEKCRILYLPEQK